MPKNNLNYTMSNNKSNHGNKTLKREIVQHHLDGMDRRALAIAYEQPLEIINGWIDNDKRVLVITEYLKGKTVRELSSKHGVSPNTINKWVTGYSALRKENLATLKQMVIQQYIDGTDVKVLAQTHDIELDLVNKWTKEIRKANSTALKQMIYQRFKNGEDITSLSNEYNVSYSQIHGWIRKIIKDKQKENIF